LKEAHDFIAPEAKLKEVHEKKPKKVERHLWLSQAFLADNRINKHFSATSQDFAMAGRARDAGRMKVVTSSSTASPKFWSGQTL